MCWDRGPEIHHFSGAARAVFLFYFSGTMTFFFGGCVRVKKNILECICLTFFLGVCF